MRNILIIGAGQAGLQLGLDLLRHGYRVTLMAARTPQETRAGRVMSTQVMFAPALDFERAGELDLWEEQVPAIGGMRVMAGGPDGSVALSFGAPFERPANSVDQRVKVAGWLELFERRGGRIVYGSVLTSDLEGLAALFDLTIVAAGRGDLAALFDRDPARSPYDAPQRALACVYVYGMEPDPAYPEPHVGISALPTGELITIPALTVGRDGDVAPCDILFVEAVPGGPLDRWDTGRSLDAAAHLDLTVQVIEEHFPWVAPQCRSLEPTDGRAALAGAFTPTVRHPVGRVGGAAVLGMADVVVTNDPIAGQGANNAAHCAATYLAAILERGSEPFDAAWMQDTFDRYWDYAQWSTAWSNALLGPMPEHVQRVLGTAAQDPRVARRFAAGYVTPPELAEWILDPSATDAYLASLA
jgi:2-polyprenyl-6-methoxyphenol hydroxylase-like FAD-dependent oxidoreductase